MKCLLFKMLAFLLMLVPGVLLYKTNRGRSADGRLVLGKDGVPRPLGTRISTSNETSSAIPINFGTEVNATREGNYRLKNRPDCDLIEGEGFCQNDTEYNQTIVNIFNKIIASKPIPGVFTEILNETVIPIDKTDFAIIRTRVGLSSETPLCASIETIIYPKRGQTANKDWVFILNQGPVQQGVKVEKCVRANAPCNLSGGSFGQTFCRQKYIYKKLLAMDTSGNNIVSESIYMPSCCVCYISNDFALRSAPGSADIQAKSSITTNTTN